MEPKRKQNVFPRDYGDIQTAVVNLVDFLAPIVPIEHQPHRAREIAEVIVSRPSSMSSAMFLRQSVSFDGGTDSPYLAI